MGTLIILLVLITVGQMGIQYAIDSNLHKIVSKGIAIAIKRWIVLLPAIGIIWVVWTAYIAKKVLFGDTISMIVSLATIGGNVGYNIIFFLYIRKKWRIEIFQWNYGGKEKWHYIKVARQGVNDELWNYRFDRKTPPTGYWRTILKLWYIIQSKNIRRLPPDKQEKNTARIYSKKYEKKVQKIINEYRKTYKQYDIDNIYFPSASYDTN